MSVCVCVLILCINYVFFLAGWGGRHAACGILVPRPGMEPNRLHWKHSVLTTGLPGKSLYYFLMYCWLLPRLSTFLPT